MAHNGPMALPIEDILPQVQAASRPVPGTMSRPSLL
jgi:hypothetical protein